MTPLLLEIRHNPMLWLLVFVPAVFACHKLTPDSHTLLFALSVFAIVPLAALREPLRTVHGQPSGIVSD